MAQASQPPYPTEDKMGAPPPYFPEQQQNQPPMAGFVTGQSTTTVITSQPSTHVIVTGIVPSHNPMRINCPHCRADVSTSVDYETGTFTHLMAGILCLVGCWPCCLIPYCVDGCKDTQHECPHCHNTVGVARRL